MPVRSHWLVAACALLVLPSLASAQTTRLRGRFKDASTGVAVPGVAIKLTNFADTSDVRRATGGDDGAFEFKGLGRHSYRLEASRLGYETLHQVVRVTKPDHDLGDVKLAPRSIELAPITVQESPAPATQKADTTEYRASAVKTHRDATAEDLVQKLPGVTLENGQVKAQGENVQQVLVNGRPFFGSDPTAAMRNLPAEVVDRIQVYDRMSDQAEFSGFDDTQSQRTMNFILRDQKATFGKVYAGGGDDERYQTGGNATWVRGATRFTLIGLSNNINQRNFSPQDLFGSMSGSGGGGGGPRIIMHGGPGGFRPGGGRPQMIRMGGGGGGGFDPSSFFVDQQPGIATTHSGGFNYVGQWGKKVQVSSSVFVNDTDTENLQSLDREYVPPQDSLAFYRQLTTTGNRSANQRVDARLEWTPDSLNSVIFQPRAYFQRTDATNFGTAANLSTIGGVIGAAESRVTDTNDGGNLSARLTLRHRFAKRGRNVSADLNSSRNDRDGGGGQYSLTTNYEGSTTTRDTLDQRSNSTTTTDSWSARVAFTEPVSKSVQLQAIYNPSFSKSDADARTFALDPASGAYTRPDSALSNVYASRNVVQNGGLAMLVTKGPWRWLTNLSAQSQRLESEQTFPGAQRIDRTYGDVLPSVTLTGNFANRRSLRLAWSTSAAAPNIGQLQNVVNNSNPLSLTTGNPSLRPTYTNNFSLRFSEAEPMASKSRFVFANVSRTARSIANATFTALADTTVDGVFLARGTQLTRPVNLGESWNGNLFGVVSRPLKLLKSVLSLNGGGSYNRTPTKINDVTNLNTTWALRSGAVLSSNISQNLDFTVSYFASYNIARNTLSTSSSGDYFSHNAAIRFNSVVGKGFVVRQELTHALQSGVPSAYGQDVVMWNTTLGKKFLKGERGELRFTVTDVLDANRSVNRSLTETYVQDTRDRALSRYAQAVFTYSWR